MASSYGLRFVGLIGLGCLSVSLGCGESGKEQDASVQGTVTIDGELAERGTIAFHPVDEGPAAYGSIHENGTFALRIGQGDPSAPDHSLIYSGDYVATVVVRALSTPDEELGESAPPKPGVLLSAAKYSNKATSGLKFAIKSGSNVIDVPIEAAIAEPAEDEQPEAEDSELEEPETPDETEAAEEPNEVEAAEVPNETDTPAEDSDK